MYGMTSGHRKRSLKTFLRRRFGVTCVPENRIVSLIVAILVIKSDSGMFGSIVRVEMMSSMLTCVAPRAGIVLERILERSSRPSQDADDTDISNFVLGERVPEMVF